MNAVEVKVCSCDDVVKIVWGEMEDGKVAGLKME